jgi:hypothetical protein
MVNIFVSVVENFVAVLVIFKIWTIIVSKSGGRGQSRVQGISKTFTISRMGVE